MVANYSHSQYTLASVNTSGSADTGRLGLSYPVVRGLDGNWVVSLDGGYTRTQQNVSGLSQAFQPRELWQVNATVTGNSGERDLQLGNSYWTAALIGTHGWVSQDLQGGTDVTGVLGDYNKVRGTVLRKQNLGDSGFYVLADLRAQVADRNLDAYEKLAFGGQGGVRAYRVDEGSFDAGGVLTLELRKIFRLPTGHVISPGIVFDGALGWFNMAPYSNWQTNLGYANFNLHQREPRRDLQRQPCARAPTARTLERPRVRSPTRASSPTAARPAWWSTSRCPRVGRTAPA